jgi:hypothetical protein
MRCVVCLMFVCSCVVVVWSFTAHARAFLNFARCLGGTPKIVSPLRRNMCAQIYVPFDGYGCSLSKRKGDQAFGSRKACLTGVVGTMVRKHAQALAGCVCLSARSEVLALKRLVCSHRTDHSCAYGGRAHSIIASGARGWHLAREDSVA